MMNFMMTKQKKILFKKNDLSLINSFVLDENAWWNDYFHCLENSIGQQSNKALFENELNEIIDFKKNGQKFKSIYYILQK